MTKPAWRVNQAADMTDARLSDGTTTSIHLGDRHGSAISYFDGFVRLAPPMLI